MRVPQKGTADRGHADFVRFAPISSGVLQTLENKAPILLDFAPILSDLALQSDKIRQNQRVPFGLTPFGNPDLGVFYRKPPPLKES